MLHPVIASRDVTRYILDTFGLRAKKKFGQNFLINEQVVRGIAREAQVGPGDLVLEIGPGIGTLTQALAETGAQVKSVEIDRTLLHVLAKTLEGYDNVEIVPGDVLKVDLGEVTEHRPFTVAANLPYYITTPIIFALLEENLPLQRLVVMVQKEVAERMIAAPGGKDYGPLSLALQYYSQPRLAIPVPARDFMPAPKVDSMVVDVPAKLYFRVVKAAFSQRRKMLSNCLKTLGITPDQVKALLDGAGIDGKRRGESLSMDEFGSLARAYGKLLEP